MPPKPAAKKEQPKDSVGTRKGCERYVWELKDNNKEFWMLGHAPVKIVSLICLLLDMYLFSLFPVHPILTLILTMELSILLFFIVIHTLAINRYLVFILWPITDILNDLLCGGFLLGGLIFAVHIRRSMPMSYFVAVVLMGVTATLSFVDVCFQRKDLRIQQAKRLAPPEKPAGRRPRVKK